MCVYVLFKSANPTFHYKFRDGFVLTEIFHFNRRMVYIWTYSYILAHMCVYFVFKSTNPTFHYTFRDGFVLKEIFHFSLVRVESSRVVSHIFVLVHNCTYVCVFFVLVYKSNISLHISRWIRSEGKVATSRGVANCRGHSTQDNSCRLRSQTLCGD